MTYDTNNDGQLSMNELYTILDVEDSIFSNVSTEISVRNTIPPTFVYTAAITMLLYWFELS